MTTHPQCAVVIPTFNGAHLVSTCLEALLSYPPARCEMRVIVVDDASTDDTVERFGSIDDRVTVVARERNGGFAHACNDGAAAAGDVEHLVFLNNDTIPIPGWLDELVDEMAERDVAAVGSKLLYPDGTVQHAGIAIGQDRWPHNLYVGLPDQHHAVNRPKRVAAATAACLLIRRTVFEEMEGFDTAYLNGYEDVDLCLRMGERGQQVRYCPTSVLYHLESVTRWADYSVRHTSDNDRLYAERWLDRVVPDDIDHYLADGLISFEYGPTFPVRMSISPLLATVDREAEDEDRLERLLLTRTEELMDLRAEQTRDVVEGRRREPAPPLIGPMRARSGGSAELVHQGDFHRLGSGPSPQRVSVLMPLMDAGAALRQTLPILLGQEVDAELEIVAVDSASTDDTVEVLEEFGATVLAIDPAEFDHGLTRNSLPCWGPSPPTPPWPAPQVACCPIRTRTCSPSGTWRWTRAAQRSGP
jgi:GT2 family glycosyltransferase